MRRFAARATPVAFTATAAMAFPSRTFFGKGWDNASLDITYKCVLRKPEIHDKLKAEYARVVDSRTLEFLRKAGDKADKNNKNITIYLPPHLGDPHRLLKAYSLTAYPILDEKGEQMKIDFEGMQKLEAFADPDDDYSKVVIPNLDLVEYIAQDLLKTLNWEATPRGAASFLEALYRGAEIPDHVFATEAVIERF